MNDLEKALIQVIQSGFPVDSRPYLRLAEQIGTTEEHVIEMIKDLKASGHIKRLGAIFDSKKLGYKSTLCAAKVPESQVEATAAVINQYEGVTHNYIREDAYNMWFTLIAQSDEMIGQTLAEIKAQTQVEEILNLPATHLFKINVNFDLT